jgi:CheY-like chemotaxis protein
MRSLRAGGIARVLTGETTVEELDRVLGDSGEGRSSSTPAPERPSMLIVDDDALNRRIARSIMEKQGYGVTEAADGIEALEKVSSQRFNLIVLDLDMPRMSGHQVLSKLKSSINTSSIPVVVLTASGNTDVETQLMDEGADDFMTKPLDPGRFTARVKAVLRRMRA